MIKLDHLDHLVLTVADIEKTANYYTEVLGMEEETFGDGRKALRFGKQKINLHQAGHEFEPKAKTPRPGSADLCFIVATAFEDAITHLARYKIPIEQGPVERTGAIGPIRSIYIRDPDGNLIEISTAKPAGS